MTLANRLFTSGIGQRNVLFDSLPRFLSSFFYLFAAFVSCREEICVNTFHGSKKEIDAIGLPDYLQVFGYST